MSKTACILTIGNEILSGQVTDKNTNFLIKKLNKKFISVRKISLVCDDVFDISNELTYLLKLNPDYIFTSGGIGPTHDDLTLQAIATCFSVPLKTNQYLKYLFTKGTNQNKALYFQNQISLPLGTRLLPVNDSSYPLLAFRNIFVFPGVPDFFRRNFASIEKYIWGKKTFSKSISVSLSEYQFGALLEEINAKYPELELGSYPSFLDNEYITRLVFKSDNKDYLQRSYKDLIRVIEENFSREVFL